MADEQNPENVPTGDAPTSEAQPDDSADDSVTLTGAQLKSIENSIWAKARKLYQRGEVPDDAKEAARRKRADELLAKYEAGETFKENVAFALAHSKARQAAPQPAAPSQPSRLEQMFEMFLTTQLADKMPKPPVTYATQGDQVRGEINAAIADIAPDDPKRHEKVQAAVMNKLRGVKVTPGASPRTPQFDPSRKKG